MNEKKGRTAALIRAALCVVVMVVVILGWLEIMPSEVGIIIASGLLCGVSLWNGIEAVRNGRKGAGIFNFIMSGVLILLCVTAILL